MRVKGQILAALIGLLILGFFGKLMFSSCEPYSRKLALKFDSNNADTLGPLLGGGKDGVEAFRSLILSSGTNPGLQEAAGFAILDAPELVSEVIDKCSSLEYGYFGTTHEGYGDFLVHNIEPEGVRKLQPLLKEWLPFVERDDGLPINLKDPNEVGKIGAYQLLRAAEACGRQEHLTRRVTELRWPFPVYDPAQERTRARTPVHDADALRSAILEYRKTHSADQVARRLIALADDLAPEFGLVRLSPKLIVSAIATESAYDILEAWSTLYVPIGGGGHRSAIAAYCAANAPLGPADRDFIRRRLAAKSRTTKLIYDDGLKGVASADEHYDNAVFYLPGFISELMNRGLWMRDKIRSNKALNEHFTVNAGAVWRAANPAERGRLRPLLASHLPWIIAALQDSRDPSLVADLLNALALQPTPTHEEMESWAELLRPYAAQGSDHERIRLAQLASLWAGLDVSFGRSKIIVLLGECRSPLYEQEILRYLKSGNAWRQIHGLTILEEARLWCASERVKLLAGSSNWEVRRHVAQVIAECPSLTELSEVEAKLRDDGRREVVSALKRRNRAETPNYVELLKAEP